MKENPLEKFINKNQKRAEKYHAIIEEMLSSGLRYQYAESTLADILEYVEREGTITDAQVEAVENIREKPNERYW